jgi:hypothetical protein
MEFSHFLELLECACIFSTGHLHKNKNLPRDRAGDYNGILGSHNINGVIVDSLTFQPNLLALH